jgi:hypothetical protein
MKSHNHNTKVITARRRRLKLSASLLAAAGLTGLLCTNVQADHASYSFKQIAELGDSAPAGGFHINDFEPGAINNAGDVIYGTDLGTLNDPATFFGEGVFLQQDGEVSELARGTGSAPGGGTFDFLLLGQTALNDRGNGAFAFTLSPFSFPVGVNSGLYRYSRRTEAVTPVVLPGATPAPAGGTFAGVFFGTSLNNRGDLVFQGIVTTDKGIHLPGEAYTGLGMGVFRTGSQGGISNVASPGDAAPGGGFFDAAGVGGSWINARGDVAFTAHVAGEDSLIEGNPPQAQIMSALGSLYVKRARNGAITSIAHSGDPAPRGGAFRQAYSPVLNDSGDVVFLGDLSSPPHAGQVLGVYLHSGGQTIAVARPGDAMPGGGTLVTASSVSSQQIHLNNRGDVVFNASLDTGGPAESGLFVWSDGSVRLIARTSTVIPGVGTIAQMTMGVILIPPPVVVTPNSGAINNDRGQVLFGATLSDGRGVLLVASPSHGHNND